MASKFCVRFEGGLMLMILKERDGIVLINTASIKDASTDSSQRSGEPVRRRNRGNTNMAACCLQSFPHSGQRAVRRSWVLRFRTRFFVKGTANQTLLSRLSSDSAPHFPYILVTPFSPKWTSYCSVRVLFDTIARRRYCAIARCSEGPLMYLGGQAP